MRQSSSLKEEYSDAVHGEVLYMVLCVGVNAEWFSANECSLLGVSVAGMIGDRYPVCDIFGVTLVDVFGNPMLACALFGVTCSGVDVFGD